MKELMSMIENTAMTDPWVIERDVAPTPRISLMDDMIIERGDLTDWRLLEALHYKQSGSLPAGSHHWKLTLYGETIGVLVMASPKLLLKERHVMFPKIKPGRDSRLTNTWRMKWLNANMQVIGRVVIDTTYRGAGLAYRFANLASRLEGKRFIEIQSSMSKYNLFAQKAGFSFVKPMHSNKYEIGMKFFRETFDADPADLEAILAEIMSLPEEIRPAIEERCRTFYLKNSALENTGKSLNGVGEKRVARLPIRNVLQNIQQMVLASPLYGVYVNPDYGRELPERVKLSAFDNQKTNEPLDLESLNEKN